MEENKQQQALEMVEVVDSATQLMFAQNKSEVDMQIATAKRYPRDIPKCINDIVTWATMDDETAQSCFYSMPRNGENGTSVVEGLSVRMAEIFADAWGNLRCGSRVINNDGKAVTAQGFCFDLERNVCVLTEVRQRVTTKYGKPMSDDMQITIANSACSKAFRNAVLKVIPKAITAKAVNEVKKVALGEAINMSESRAKIIKAFSTFGVSESQILEYLEIKRVDDIDAEMRLHLLGLYTAIKEGDTNVEDGIINVIKERRKAKQAESESKSNSEAIKMAAQRAQATAKAAESFQQPVTENSKK